MPTEPSNTTWDWLRGGGQMGERIRAMDWSRTPLGPPSSWSPTLRTILRLLLLNRFPQLLWWGPEFCQFYNDPYRPVLGDKHPNSMGQPARECWREIWQIIGPLVETPFGGGPPTWMEDIPLEFDRYGFVEETHFTIAYSPVPDDTVASGIGGVLATVHEITEKVVGERRVVALRDLGARAEARTAGEACRAAAETMAKHAKDIPFALLYLIDPDGTRARLAAVAGTEASEAVSPEVVELTGTPGGPWPLTEVVRRESLHHLEDLEARLGAHVPAGPWSDPPREAAIVPIRSNLAHRLAGLLVVGISPRLRFDDSYRSFLELAASQVATAIANARAYEEEKRRAEALAEIDRAKTVFFSNVSHEFRTPLTLMLGPLGDAVSAEPPVGLPHDQLAVVHRNGLRLLKLVNTLLDFSRIEAGRAQASYEPVDLAASTAELASVFRSAIERAGMELVIDCPTLAEPVYVDREMWEKVVLNLLSNAFKFTFEGRIEVRLGLTPSGAELRVRDTGVGIPAPELPRLFERFHRVAGTRGRSYEGSGIGLALVRELVRLHGGEVQVESRVGSGSTFIVSLPRGFAHLPAERLATPRAHDSTTIGAEAYVQEALRWLPDAERIEVERNDVEAGIGSAWPAGTGDAPDRSSHRPHVLLADDNADLRDYVRRLLEPQYRVETVSDGDAAIRAVRARRHDIVVTDVMMPGLDGFGLLKALRADETTATVPVILLSARAGEESRIEGLEAGADDYLVKPFSARELQACVAAHLGIARVRREAEIAVRQRTAQFETLLNQAPLGVFLVDADFRIREVNPVAIPVFGDIPGGVVGRDFDEIIHRMWPQDYADEITRIFRHTLRTGEPYVTPERSEPRIDRGAVESYEWRIDRLTLPDGRHGLVCYFRDISQQVEARRELAALATALQDADRRKDEFLATLAHELRNPLAPVRNAAHYLKLRNLSDPDLRRPVEMIERQVTHMVRLVDDLFDVSRIARGVLELRIERLVLDDVVRAALDICRDEIDRHGHTLRVRLPDPPVVLPGDRHRLVQVLCNLISNAAKYTPRGGEIELAALAIGDATLDLRVADNGVGIPPDKLTAVFELFTQIDRSLERQGGLGIGLTLARQLVELHGGTIEATSRGVGHGSTFIVRLPLAPAPSTEPSETSVAAERGPEPRRILVADDNQDAAESLALLLRSHGHTVRIASHGEAALSLARELAPQVVFLDIGMPRLNGYEVARRIRQEPWGARMRLVALTGWGQESDRQRAEEAGFDAHWVKPIPPDTLQPFLTALETEPIEGSAS